MPSSTPSLSLIVPTRGRPEPLRRLLGSVAATARHPDRIEIVLVTDDDSPVGSLAFSNLNIKQVVGPPERTMGELNHAGYEASHGDYVMLLNDDVIVRTRGWDRTVLECFRQFPDPIALVHVNDTLIRDYLCTFPILSRKYCELIGGICPRDYERYRIDDHIEDVFNMLATLGIRRSIYLPDVIFEHCNSVNHPTAGLVYVSDPEILARDALRFDAALPLRKQQVRTVLESIESGHYASRQVLLDRITDSFALRNPGRQLVVRAAWWQRAPRQLLEIGNRIRQCYKRTGITGLANAAVGRLNRLRFRD